MYQIICTGTDFFGTVPGTEQNSEKLKKIENPFLNFGPFLRAEGIFRTKFRTTFRTNKSSEPKSVLRTVPISFAPKLVPRTEPNKILYQKSVPRTVPYQFVPTVRPFRGPYKCDEIYLDQESAGRSEAKPAYLLGLDAFFRCRLSTNQASSGRPGNFRKLTSSDVLVPVLVLAVPVPSCGPLVPNLISSFRNSNCSDNNFKLIVFILTKNRI